MGATAPKLDEPRRCVLAALRYDLYQRVRAATLPAREVPLLLLRLDDSTLSQGVADLTFREPEAGR